jgi:hypothetical protein
MPVPVKHVNRLVTVRIDTGSPPFQVRIELHEPLDPTRMSSLHLTDAEARELGEVLRIFMSQETFRSITGDPNVYPTGNNPPRPITLPGRAWLAAARCGVPLVGGGFCMEPASPGCCYCDLHADWKGGA